ncbi:hypothetical protein B0O80DRAFT_149125 [Mortierella sp. GBAus27b]|nr:hypothetical protein B0O80DRAFT_149125 [Mortierella sp. GBAus27b]
MISEAPTPTIATNTITITNLQGPHFEKDVMLKLKAKAEEHGEVYYFAPIKSFYRVFVVYHSTFDAQRAKGVLHNSTFEDTTIRVYYGQVSLCPLFVLWLLFGWMRSSASFCFAHKPTFLVIDLADLEYGDLGRPGSTISASSRAGEELAHLPSWLAACGMDPGPRRPTQLDAPGR